MSGQVPVTDRHGDGRPGRAAVLRDRRLDLELAERGYIVMPFLEQAEVADLVEAHSAARPVEDAGLTIDFVRPDRSMMHLVDELLAPMWASHLHEHVIDYRPVVSTFVVKHPGPDSAMALHHEPTFAHAGAPTFNVWIPLVDVTADLDNGRLQLVPGSQHLAYGLVGFNTPPEFRPYESVLARHSISLDVAAGSAVVYDTRMLHASEPNRSASPRPAIAAAIAPAGAQLVNVVATGRRHRVVYAVDRDFFLEVHPLDASTRLAEHYPRLDEVDEVATISAAAIAQLVGSGQIPEPAVLGPADLLALAPDASSRLQVVADPAASVRSVDLESPAPAADSPSIPGVEVENIDGDVWTAVRASSGAATRRRSWLRRWSRNHDGIRHLVLGHGARCRLTSADSVGLELRVIECSRLASGVAHADGLAQFDNDVVVTVPAGTAWLWNEGPGPLVVEVCRRLS